MFQRLHLRRDLQYPSSENFRTRSRKNVQSGLVAETSLKCHGPVRRSRIVNGVQESVRTEVQNCYRNPHSSKVRHRILFCAEKEIGVHHCKTRRNPHRCVTEMFFPSSLIPKCGLPASAHGHDIPSSTGLPSVPPPPRLQPIVITSSFRICKVPQRSCRILLAQ
jgi:hypothetical protein